VEHRGPAAETADPEKEMVDPGDLVAYSFRDFLGELPLSRLKFPFSLNLSHSLAAPCTSGLDQLEQCQGQTARADH
jgi:hypothetical protein